MEQKIKEQTKELKILCPFCGKEQDLKTTEEFEQTLCSCESCGIYENDIDYKIEIRCCKCGRVIYVKEGNKEFDY
jgi:predicted RNA-binding Zn-ribbon protein involved in translation (DUF1610 family)